MVAFLSGLSLTGEYRIRGGHPHSRPIFELLHVLHVVPVRMGEDIRIDPVGMQAEFSLKVPMNLRTAAFPAVVVVSAGALLIRQSGIYQDFVLPGINEMTADRLPFSFPWGLSGKFRSRAPREASRC